MKSSLFKIFLALLLVGGNVTMAQDFNQPFNEGEINPYSKYFTGETHLNMLCLKDDIWNLSMCTVYWISKDLECIGHIK